MFSGQIQNNGYSSPQQEYYYAKYSLNNLFNKGEISLSFNGVTGIKKASGQPISYIEIQDGNLVSAVYIYLGYGEWSGDQPGPAGEQGLYHGACNWNSNTQIPLLHYSVMS